MGRVLFSLVDCLNVDGNEFSNSKTRVVQEGDDLYRWNAGQKTRGFN